MYLDIMIRAFICHVFHEKDCTLKPFPTNYPFVRNASNFIDTSSSVHILNCLNIKYKCLKGNLQNIKAAKLIINLVKRTLQK